jgi:TonB family protein
VAVTEAKRESAIDKAFAEMQEADKRLRDLDNKLQGLEKDARRIDALTELRDALQGLREVGGEDPVLGGKLGRASYQEILGRIGEEADRYVETRDRLRKERSDAAAISARATQAYDKAREKADEEERKRRKEALEAYRREVIAKGFQAKEGDIFYRPMGIPWGGRTDDDRRYRRISLLVALLTLLLAVGVSWVVLPQIEVKETPIPKRLAKLLVEREKKPPAQPVKPKEQALTPKQQAAAPRNATERRAREKVKNTGLLAMSDTLNALKQTNFDKKLGSQARLTTSGRYAQEAQRSIVTSNVTSGSGGIATGGLSRDVGGGGLGNVQTSKVHSSLADQLAAAADRRVVGSARASRTDEEIQIVFDRNKSALYALYNRELRVNPSLQGKVVLKLTIAPSGRVTMCVVMSSSLHAPGLERKIAQRVKLFNFGAKKVDAVTITYPIDFLPA